MYKPVLSVQTLLALAAIRTCSCQLNFRTKDLKIETSGPCPESQKNAIQMLNYSNVHISRNVIAMNSDIVVSRNITGALSFQMKVKRCTLDMTRCDAYDTFRIDKICDRLVERNAMWSPYLSNIVPPVRCPIHQNTYHLTNGTTDYTLAARLPIDGHRWLSYMKLFEQYADEHTKRQRRRQIWCLDSDVRITLSKGPPAKRRH